MNKDKYIEHLAKQIDLLISSAYRLMEDNAHLQKKLREQEKIISLLGSIREKVVDALSSLAVFAEAEKRSFSEVREPVDHGQEEESIFCEDTSQTDYSCGIPQNAEISDGGITSSSAGFSETLAQNSPRQSS